MAYNFKSIANVEVVETPTDTANVLIEENGVIKKTPKTAVGGTGDAQNSNNLCVDMIISAIDTFWSDASKFSITYGDANEIINKLNNNEIVNIALVGEKGLGSVYTGNLCCMAYHVIESNLNGQCIVANFMLGATFSHLTPSAFYISIAIDPENNIIDYHTS